MNHERWAIPYGDLLTLLLAFFVVMYSISSVNEGKYRVLSSSLHAAFRGQPRALDPIEVGHKRLGADAHIRIGIVRQGVSKSRPRAHLAPLPVPRPKPAADSAAARDAVLPRVAARIDRALSALINDREVVVQSKPGRIEVQFRSDILFPSGSARLSVNATAAIRKLAAVLVHFPNPIRVEGFTDNVPIRTLQFHSNWELSAARAGSVVHVLQDEGVAPGRLAVVGFGAQRPIASNATAAGRRANRRVVVLILSTRLARHADPTWVPRQVHKLSNRSR